MTTIVKRIFQKKYNLEDVFTPATSARLTFVKREDVQKQFDKALTIPGMQLIVYGHSGSGKTTITQNILNTRKNSFITTNCILDTTINDILLDAFDQLNPFFTSEKTSNQKNTISSELKTSFFAIDSAIKAELTSEKEEKKTRALPMQLTPQRLTDFLGAAGVIWIIEDFHKVLLEERQKLSQILKIFVDASNRYPKVKVIAIGAVGTAREIVNYDSELTNRIAEIHVPLLNKTELEDIMLKGEKLLNIDFEPKIHTDIIRFSNSLAAICHHLCFSICFNNNVKITPKVKRKLKTDTLNDAVMDYLKQNSDSFKETLDKALRPRDGKFDNTKLILQSFCKSEKDELTKAEIQRFGNNKKIYGTTILEYLRLLTTVDYGEILRHDTNSGKFSFSNPFFKAYTIMQFSTEEKHMQPQPLEIVQFEEILKYLTISMKDISNMEIEIKSNKNRKKPNGQS